MTGVITYTCETFNESGHPRQGPQVRTEAVGSRPLAQFPVQPLNVLSTESRLASGPPGAVQPADASTLPLFVPSADALAAHAESPSDLGYDQLSGSEHAPGLVTPLLQSSKIPSRTKFGRHTRIICATGTIVTLLCEIQ